MVQKEVVIIYGRNSIAGIIAWPESWTDKRVVANLRKFVPKSAVITIGPASAKAPQLRLSDG